MQEGYDWDHEEYDMRFAFYIYSIESDHCQRDHQAYQLLNNALRARGSAAHIAWSPYVRHLNRALATLPDHNGTVYRGLRVEEGQRARYTMANQVHWSGFSSTSVPTLKYYNTSVT